MANGTDPTDMSIERLFEMCKISTVRRFDGRNFKCDKCFIAMHR